MECKICSKGFKSYENLFNHLANVHEVDIDHYIDSFLYKNSKKTVSIGLKKIGPCNELEDKLCGVCGTKLNGRNAISHHVKKEHGMDFKQYLDKYVYGGKPPVCKLCGSDLRFYKGRYFECSVACWLPEKCEVCGNYYENPNQLSRHLTMIHGISNFKYYLDTHVSSNPPKCKDCGADLFFESGSYTERCSMRCNASYKCKICGMGCAKPETLTSHVRKYHNMKSRDYVNKYDWEGKPGFKNLEKITKFPRGLSASKDFSLREISRTRPVLEYDSPRGFSPLQQLLSSKLLTFGHSKLRSSEDGYYENL